MNVAQNHSGLHNIRCPNPNPNQERKNMASWKITLKGSDGKKKEKKKKKKKKGFWVLLPIYHSQFLTNAPVSSDETQKSTFLTNVTN